MLLFLFVSFFLSLFFLFVCLLLVVGFMFLSPDAGAWCQLLPRRELTDALAKRLESFTQDLASLTKVSVGPMIFGTLGQELLGFMIFEPTCLGRCWLFWENVGKMMLGKCLDHLFPKSSPTWKRLPVKKVADTREWCLRVVEMSAFHGAESAEPTVGHKACKYRWKSSFLIGVCHCHVKVYQKVSQNNMSRQFSIIFFLDCMPLSLVPLLLLVECGAHRFFQCFSYSVAWRTWHYMALVLDVQSISEPHS